LTNFYKSIINIKWKTHTLTTEPTRFKSASKKDNIEDLFTYVLVRDDLQMTAGKLAAQATHASRLSLLKYLKQNPTYADDFINNNHCGSTVVLSGKNLFSLLKAREQAIKLDLPCALFTDSGHIFPPHFNGDPIVTALAIGPALKAEIYPITRKFRCL
jgi:peptidyl-tRNA hydrolase